MLIVSTALLMWMPVCGPLPEMRLSLPGQMFYLFLQSIIPTIPSAWLIFAEKPVYSAYDTGFHLWGINPVTDQQIAGVMMKLGEAFYIWGVILVLFFKWSSRHMEAGAGRRRRHANATCSRGTPSNASSTSSRTTAPSHRTRPPLANVAAVAPTGHDDSGFDSGRRPVDPRSGFPPGVRDEDGRPAFGRHRRGRTRPSRRACRLRR